MKNQFSALEQAWNNFNHAIQTAKNNAGAWGRLFGFGTNQQLPQQVLGIQANPTMTPTPTPNILSEDQIRRGLLAYNPNTPLATQAAALRQGMQTLAKTKINPIDLLTFYLRESQGGLTQAGQFNPGNVRDSTGKHAYVAYPDYKTSILGGWNPEYGVQSQGVVGTIMNDPRYKQYRETGDTNIFNSVWTPESDNNPSAQELTARMRSLERYFK